MKFNKKYHKCTYTIKQKVLVTLTIILILFTLIYDIFAEENETNTTNSSSNDVQSLTLEQQKNQVQEALANANEQLTYVDNELSEAVIQIQKLNDKIATYQAQLDEINSKYNDLQTKVSEYEEKLKTAQIEYNKKDKLLKARLVEFYKRGTTSYLDVLLSSRDIIEFISNYFIVQEITEYDSKDLAELAEKKQTIEKTTNELQEAKANMKITKAEAEKQSIILTNTRTIVENYQSSLTDSEKEITSKIDAYKKQEEELNSLISNAISGSTYELQYSGGVMIWPTLSTCYITSGFGTRVHPIQGIIKNHDGIDIGGQTGYPIYAASDGVVIYSGWMGGYGNATMIDHGLNQNGVKIVTLYGHGSKLLKTVGDTVKKGDQIMEMGSTGNSTGPHVHFEVRENGIAVDPKTYLSSSTDQ